MPPEVLFGENPTRLLYKISLPFTMFQIKKGMWEIMTTTTPKQCFDV